MSAAALLALPVGVRQTLEQAVYNQSKSLQLSSSPREKSYPREAMANHTEVRHIHAEKRHESTDLHVVGLIPAIYGHRPVKCLMRDGDCSDKAARNMRSGETLPSTRVLIRLMAANQQVFDAVCQAIGRVPQRPVTSDHELDQLRADVADLQRRIEGMGA